MPRRATLAPHCPPHTSAWAIVAVVLSGLGLTIGGVVLALYWFVATVVFRPADPAVENRAVVAKEVKYDECSHQISARLERHYEWNSTTPLDVTLIAYTPDGPAEGVRVTQRVTPPSTTLTVQLTSEQAVAFANPEVRRTVSLRRADGQLVLAEQNWPLAW